jgi:hypothetical protein
MASTAKKKTNKGATEGGGGAVLFPSSTECVIYKLFLARFYGDFMDFVPLLRTSYCEFMLIRSGTEDG